MPLPFSPWSRCLPALGALALALAACQHDAAPPAPSPAPGNPLGGLERDADARELTGVVAERLTAGRYSYLRIHAACDRDCPDRWVATTGAGAEVGERVRVHSFGLRRDFDSPRLGRRFDELVFGTVRVDVPTT